MSSAEFAAEASVSGVLNAGSALAGAGAAPAGLLATPYGPLSVTSSLTITFHSAAAAWMLLQAPLIASTAPQHEKARCVTVISNRQAQLHVVSAKLTECAAVPAHTLCLPASSFCS